MNSYYASIDMVLTELQPKFREKEQEIICALGNICYSETLNEESFFRVAKCYEIDEKKLAEHVREFATFARIRPH